MTWQAVATFLACARIGAVHSVVFAGFSAEALWDRIQDCKCRVVITSDEGRRGGKMIANKVIVDAAVKECPLVEHVLVLQRTGNKVPWTEGRDKWWHEETLRVPNYCPPEVMSSEDPLFILYVCRLLLKFSRHVNIQIPIFSDLWIYRKAEGCGSHYRRISFVCCFDREICIQCSSRWQVRLHGWCGLDHRSHVSVHFSLSIRAFSFLVTVTSSMDPLPTAWPQLSLNPRLYTPLPLGNGCKTQIDSILFCSHCHPAVVPTWRTACSGSWLEQFACSW